DCPTAARACFTAITGFFSLTPNTPRPAATAPEVTSITCLPDSIRAAISAQIALKTGRSISMSGVDNTAEPSLITTVRAELSFRYMSEVSVDFIIAHSYHRNAQTLEKIRGNFSPSRALKKKTI